MKLPDDLRRIRDAADPRDLDAIKIGLVGGLIAAVFVSAPKLIAWWLVWASAQIDALARLVSLY